MPKKRNEQITKDQRTPKEIQAAIKFLISSEAWSYVKDYLQEAQRVTLSNIMDLSLAHDNLPVYTPRDIQILQYKIIEDFLDIPEHLVNKFAPIYNSENTALDDIYE
jgi:hypothetical protein